MCITDVLSVFSFLVRGGSPKRLLKLINGRYDVRQLVLHCLYCACAFRRYAYRCHHSRSQSSTFFSKIASREALVMEKFEFFNWLFKNGCATRYNILPFYA